MDEHIRFVSTEEELKYWKKKAFEYKKGFEEAREELDEFQTHSKDLEHELEFQLDEAEKRNREMRTVCNQLQMEKDTLRDKLEQAQREYCAQIQELQADLAQYHSVREELSKYIRELEQANDDLERAKRATLVSLEDFQGQLNQAIERNAFLESELDEKEALKMMVQRLKDEARDLRQELQIRERDSDGEALDNDKKVEHSCKAVDSNKRVSENETQTVPGSPMRKSSSQPVPLTPSARISALNIVGDLLRKVGALESKLASCRNLVKDVPPSPNSPNKEQRSFHYEEYIRSRPLPRGPSAPSVQGLIRA